MNQFNRNIFTETPSKTEKALDVALAIFIGLLLTVGALAYFDVLVK
jgi:hypothetical protein